MIPINLLKNLFFLVYTKMEQENIMFFENDDKSYTMVDLYLYDRFLGYKDSCNYYDANVDKLLLLKKVIMNILLDIIM